MTYSEKLKDPRWQKLRLQVFERDGWKCLACGSDARTLHVHHLEYNGDPWDARPEMLETLCEECHGVREEFNKFTLAAFRHASSARIVPLENAIREFGEKFPEASIAITLASALLAKARPHDELA